MNATTTTIEPGSMADLMARAKAYVEANYTLRPSFVAVAQGFDLSPFHFHRQFKKAHGVTVKQMVDARLMEDAKAKLKRGESLLDIALDLGFEQQSHFTTRFKQLVGVTPGAYRKSGGAP